MRYSYRKYAILIAIISATLGVIIAFVYFLNSFHLLEAKPILLSQEYRGYTENNHSGKTEYDYIEMCIRDRYYTYTRKNKIHICISIKQGRITDAYRNEYNDKSQLTAKYIAKLNPGNLPLALSLIHIFAPETALVQCPVPWVSTQVT